MLAFIAALAASAALAPATPTESTAPERTLFDVIARVEVDAAGAIVAIKPSATTPAINDAVDANIRKLHFSPPILQGQPVTGATWVRMQVCSTQVGSDQQLAMRYHGSGPDW